MTESRARWASVNFFVLVRRPRRAACDVRRKYAGLAVFPCIYGRKVVEEMAING